MSDQNALRVSLGAEVDVRCQGVRRWPDGSASLNLSQQNGGYVTIRFTMVQAHEVGKMLLFPEMAEWIIARERGVVQPDA
jgi:hypothetical protein